MRLGITFYERRLHEGTASSLKGSSVVEALKILFKLKKNERNIWKK